MLPTVILAVAIIGEATGDEGRLFTAASDGYHGNQGRMFGHIASQDSFLDYARHQYHTDENYRHFVTAGMRTWRGLSVTEQEMNEQQNRSFHGENEIFGMLMKDKYFSDMHGSMTGRTHDNNQRSQQAIKFYYGLLSTTSTEEPSVNTVAADRQSYYEFYLTASEETEENYYEFD